MPNINYWSNKQTRSERAAFHTLLMEKDFKDAIQESVTKSKIYSPDTAFIENPSRWDEMKVSLVNEGSGDAIMRLADEHMAVLNFASYTHPGGQFINGSSAQEESLCHESTLYNVLVEFPAYYKENSTTRNDFMYTNRAIYSPDIVFQRKDKIVPCDVITCAAPNLSGNWKFHNRRISRRDNNETLKSRCRFVLEIAKENNVQTLILGAFGCGVFGQDPSTVATYFSELLTGDFKGCFREVVFAIPIAANPENYNAFGGVLQQYGLI